MRSPLLVALFILALWLLSAECMDAPGRQPGPAAPVLEAIEMIDSHDRLHSRSPLRLQRKLKDIARRIQVYGNPDPDSFRLFLHAQGRWELDKMRTSLKRLQSDLGTTIENLESSGLILDETARKLQKMKARLDENFLYLKYYFHRTSKSPFINTDFIKTKYGASLENLQQKYDEFEGKLDSAHLRQAPVLGTVGPGGEQEWTWENPWQGAGHEIVGSRRSQGGESSSSHLRSQDIYGEKEKLTFFVDMPEVGPIAEDVIHRLHP